ncbi:MAG: hypothetical protein EOM69_09170, partial [Clostridia bacterium]|nr:hypothetical protein [Clostridia bacterium]
MSGFLVPLNYVRAREVLQRLSAFAGYSEEMAVEVHAVLRQSYPLLFARAEERVLERGALLLELTGASASDPLVFVSHLDAAQPAAESDLAGDVMRAQLSRAHVVTLLEAVETLLAEGYHPGGDLYIALSMDGLTGGEGARAMAAALKGRGVSPCFVLDFGGYVTQSAFCSFLPKGSPLALIGISEKGLLEGRLSADAMFMQRRDERKPQALNAVLRAGARLTRRQRKKTLCKTSEQMLLALSKRAPLFRSLLLKKPRLTFP